MQNILRLTFAITLSVLLAACSGGTDNTDTPTAPKKRVKWSGIPSQYNPSTDDLTFITSNIETLNLNIFGFNDDTEVVYSSDIPAGQGVLRLYKVYKNSASWGSLSSRVDGNALSISTYGSYSCSIRISNGQIAELDGGCYIRMQVFLPAGSEIEVYNIGKLISKRFKGMSVESFLKALHNASFDENKRAVITEFLQSYQSTGKTPVMTTNQLGTVIGEFMRNEEKLKALRRLHSFVSDRENLGQMIEDKFNYYDRGEARRIVGL